MIILVFWWRIEQCFGQLEAVFSWVFLVYMVFLLLGVAAMEKKEVL
jgi:uncharacterized membrane protein